MNHAGKISAAAKDKVRPLYKGIQSAGLAYATAQKVLLQSNDVEDVMRGLVDLIMAAERLVEAAKAAEYDCRAILEDAILETGAPKVQTMHQSAFLSKKAAFVSIDGEPELEDRFYNPRTYNKAEIKKALEAKEDVPGCRMVRPNSFTLKIQARK